MCRGTGALGILAEKFAETQFGLSQLFTSTTGHKLHAPEMIYISSFLEGLILMAFTSPKNFHGGVFKAKPSWSCRLLNPNSFVILEIALKQH